jgi:DNA-binding response OmpR family regulator
MGRPSRFATTEELIAYRDAIWEKYTYRFGDWVFRWVTREVFNGRRFVARLSSTESDLLKLIIEHYPIPISGDRLADELTKLRETPYDDAPIYVRNDVKVFIRRLRQRLGASIIYTVGTGTAGAQSSGYLFNPPIAGGSNEWAPTAGVKSERSQAGQAR